MDYKEKSKIVDRICSCGYFYNPNVEGVYEADESKPLFISNSFEAIDKTFFNYVYESSYKKALELGMEKEEVIIDRAIRDKRFASDWKELIEVERNNIEELTLDYINHMNDEKNKGTIKKKIAESTAKINSIYLDKSRVVGGSSAEHYASECENRCRYIKMIVNSRNNLDEETALDRCFLNCLEQAIYENRLSTEVYRELARTNPWRIYWAAGEKNAENIFGKSISDLSDEQIELCYWTRFYDSIYEAYEKPSDEIISDDLALDSWYANRIKKESRENSAKSLVSKGVNKHKEIFVKTTPEGAKKVYAANDPAVRAAMKQREKIIETEGTIKESEVIKKQGRITSDLFVSQKKGK